MVKLIYAAAKVMLTVHAGNMSDWAAAFKCKIHLPVADQQWVTEPGNYISHWSGIFCRTLNTQ